MAERAQTKASSGESDMAIRQEWGEYFVPRDQSANPTAYWAVTMVSTHLPGFQCQQLPLRRKSSQNYRCDFLCDDALKTWPQNS